MHRFGMVRCMSFNVSLPQIALYSSLSRKQPEPRPIKHGLIDEIPAGSYCLDRYPFVRNEVRKLQPCQISHTRKRDVKLALLDMLHLRHQKRLSWPEVSAALGEVRWYELWGRRRFRIV